MTNPFNQISNYYSTLIDRYGYDPRACDYGRAESQQIKFKVLSEVGDYHNRRVLDVGCGFADFADYLNERFGSLDYSGIDITPRMVEEARHLRNNLNLRVGNILEEEIAEKYDIVTANGIFYLLGTEAQLLMQEIVNRMFALASVAVAFNSLSSWTENKEPGEFYADPLETVEFCRTLTPWVVLRHDYHPRDFTIYLYKK